MLTTITYKRGILRIGEIWFREPEPKDKVDYIRVRQCDSVPSFPNARPFYTLLIDLNRDVNAILSSMSKGTRYKILRAVDRDNLQYTYLEKVTNQDIQDFCRFYNNKIRAINISEADPVSLERYASFGCLDLSKVQTTDGYVLVWHAYIVSGKRARLLLSASTREMRGAQTTNACIGRANRFAHWQDMLRFKEKGIRFYDFGGWYPGEQDLKKLNINRFKEGFGGQLAKDYNYEKALTFRGHIYMKIRETRHKLRMNLKG